MTQAQAVQELEIGPQFISLGSSTIQTRNIASVAIFPNPKDAKTQVEWDQKKDIQRQQDEIYAMNSQKCLKSDLEEKIRKFDSRKINGIGFIVLWLFVLSEIIHQSNVGYGIWYCIFTFWFPLLLVLKLIDISKELKPLYAKTVAIEKWLKANESKTYPPSVTQLPYSADDRSAFSVLFFSVVLTINSGQKFSIQCPNLEYAYDLRRLVEAAWRGTDVAVYHVDSRTQNIHMVVHANIKINNDIDQIMSRLEQLRVEDRTELKAYLDDVRLIANMNAISKEEVKETQTKLDRFLD